MTKLFDTLKKFALLRAIIYIIFGVVLFLEPESVVKWLLYIVAAYLGIMGLIAIITAIVNRKENGLATFDFFSGIILLILGICLAIFAPSIAMITNVLLGIVVVICGISFLAMGINAQKAASLFGIPLIIFAIVLIAAGALMIFHPIGTTIVLGRIFAVIFVLMGIGEIVAAIALRKVKAFTTNIQTTAPSTPDTTSTTSEPNAPDKQ